jgi:hypothetical protein
MDNTTAVWQFWLCTGIMAVLLIELVAKRCECWTKPAAALYITIFVWYLVNYLYDGPDSFQLSFDVQQTGFALIQVATFLVFYRAAVWFLIPRLAKARSIVIPKGPPLRRLTQVVIGAWVMLLFLGVGLSDWNLFGILWPPSSTEKVGLFVTSGVGSGASFLISTCEYIYLLLCAWMGVLFVLERGIGRWALAISIFASWPYYWFGRTRNRMIALLLPAMACYYLFKHRRYLQKIGVTAVVLFGVNIWFLIVANFRDVTETQYLEIATHIQAKGLQHYGVNMLEELCWSNALVKEGTYKIHYGSNYISQFVNFVPRTFWPNKPLIGWDYAIARGYGIGESEEEGVYATISTGVIGQGVINFGPYFGVLAAATLMALWNCFLSRLWLQRQSHLRVLLFLMGLGQTFNIGRDITLLALWPIVFGYGIVRLLERFSSSTYHRNSKRRKLESTSAEIPAHGVLVDSKPDDPIMPVEH